MIDFRGFHLRGTARNAPHESPRPPAACMSRSTSMPVVRMSSAALSGIPAGATCGARRQVCGASGKLASSSTSRHSSSHSSCMHGMHACTSHTTSSGPLSVRRSLANHCSTLMVVSVPRYPTNTPSTPKKYASLLQNIVILRNSTTRLLRRNRFLQTPNTQQPTYKHINTPKHTQTTN